MGLCLKVTCHDTSFIGQFFLHLYFTSNENVQAKLHLNKSSAFKSRKYIELF